MIAKAAVIFAGVLALCATCVVAEGSPWWNLKWRFRTSVERPTPWRDASPRPVEVAVDFPLLMDRAGIEGEFALGSLRVIDPRTQKPVAFAHRTEYDARRQREQMYVAWTAAPERGATGRYDLYFDTVGRQRGHDSPTPETLPPENLIANAQFDDDTDGRPKAWNVDPATLASLGTFAHTTGKQSLRIAVDENTPDDARREAVIQQRIDVAQFAGQEMVFECDLLAERAKYGCPVTIELEQFRADGSRIREYAVQPRWLSLELAQGQLVQFSERGRFSHEAASVNVRIRMRLSVRDADTRATVTGPESFFTVWLDRVVVRPGERWPWPALSHAGFVEGALEGAPVNRGFEFTGQRRLCFNGASEGTLTANAYGDQNSVHWGLEAGTLEFWCKPSWDAGDDSEHVLFDAKAYGHRLQSRMRVLGDGQLEFTIYDSDRKPHTARGPALLKEGTWHHLAATWDHSKAHVQLFVDGKRIGQDGPGSAAWPHSLVAVVKGKQGMGIMDEDRRTMPMQAFIGGDQRWQTFGSAEAVIDELRVSSVARYVADFTPSRTEFEVDEHTRALFHFDNECHGEHASDDRFVRGHLACELQPQSEDAIVEVYEGGNVERRVAKVKPHATDDTFEANRAETRMVVHRPYRALPDPRFIEYRERSVERVIGGTDDAFALDVGGDYEPWMRCVTFEPAEGGAKTTLLPRWRANDNVVPFSVETLAATVAPNAKTDEEKMLAVFSYALDTTNYYDAPFCETPPGGPHRARVSYTLLKALNIYPMDQCGPMNHMLRKLFLACGMSSTNASGTHHQFEQAFYDGDMRLCDLSGRLYWLDRDNTTRISRRRMEEDPYLKLRQGGDVNAWLRGRKGRATYGGAERPHNMDFALRAGERVSLCWHNEGRWFELSEGRKPIRLAKIPPFFGNGAIVFKPVEGSDALALDNLAVQSRDEGGTVLCAVDTTKPANLIYRAACPYILSDCQVSGACLTSQAGGTRLSLSFDEGKSWKEVWASSDARGAIDADLRDEISARYEYWLKLDLAPGKDAAVSDLTVRTTFVASPWALPGKLSKGQNHVTFAGGPVASPVKSTCSWIERHDSDLGVSLNSLSFYLNSDQMHRNLFVAAPDGGLSIMARVHTRAGEPVERMAVLERVPEGWGVGLPLGTDAPGTSCYILRPQQAAEGTIHPIELAVRTDKGKRRVAAQVLIADCPLISEAEDADELTGAASAGELPEASGAKIVSFTGDGKLAFSFVSEQGGKYALWLRARWDEGSSTRMSLALDDAKSRDLRATSMIGFTDWTSANQANTKMFAHFGEQYSYWSWYRVPEVELTEGEHLLSLAASTGAHFDALLLLPQNDTMDRAAMNLFMNWNYAPWRNP